MLAPPESRCASVSVTPAPPSLSASFWRPARTSTSMTRRNLSAGLDCT
jgi:hypothetical protein